MCVCIKLSFLQGKIKIYIHTQLSESDINHNNEIPGYRNGSMEQLYTQQKQDQELSVAQIMNSLLPNSDLH